MIEIRQPERKERWPTAVPDDAMHVVCVKGGFVAPDGDGGRRRYKTGEELPFEIGAELLPTNPRRLMALDEDGEYAAGALGHPYVNIKDFVRTWQNRD